MRHVEIAILGCLLAASSAQADTLVLVDKAKGPKGAQCDRVEEGVKKALQAGGVQVQELKLKKGQDAAAVTRERQAQAWVSIECTVVKKKSTAKVEAFWAADALSFAGASEPYSGKADAERAGAKLGDGVVEGLKRASTPVALPTPVAAPPPEPKPAPPPVAETPKPTEVQAPPPAETKRKQPMFEIAAGAGTRIGGAYSVVVGGNATHLAYRVDPLLAIAASVRFNIPSTGLGVEARLRLSPVKYNLGGVLGPTGAAVDPAQPSGMFLDVGGTVYYRLALSGYTEDHPTGVALEPLLGFALESASVADQNPAVVLSTSALVPHAGVRGLFRVAEPFELVVDARLRLPLGTSESPTKTGDPGIGFGVSVGGGARFWLAPFLGVGADVAYDYASVSFSGTGTRVRFSSDPELTNASVATSALRVTASALAAF
ncbi:MAG: hypothetical protein U1E65_13500 [Myxococcota bacterium]